MAYENFDQERLTKRIRRLPEGAWYPMGQVKLEKTDLKNLSV